MLFWKDPRLDGVYLDDRYARLFDLAVNKCPTIAKISLWVVRLMLRECEKQLSLVVLQVGVSDRWI